MRIAPAVTFIIRSTSIKLFKQTTFSSHIYRPANIFIRTMSAEANVKTTSRQQPKWIVPTAKEIPVLKFQNSLTKTKVSFE